MPAVDRRPLEPLARRAADLVTAMQFGLKQRQRFYRDLSGLMKAGLSKGEALDGVRQIAAAGSRGNSRVLARVLSAVQTGMRNGLGFAGALEGWVPNEERMVIAAMEVGDRFPDQLGEFSQSLKKRAGERGRMFGELSYPALLICMVYGLLVHFQLKIAPILGGLLDRSEWQGIARQFDRASEMAASNILLAGAVAVLIGPATALLLRGWAGRGRKHADRLPVFSNYRARTGVLFLKSMGSLMGGGMTSVEAIDSIRSGCSPYVRLRLDLIRAHLLNGCNLGQAVELSDTGWPDRDLALSLKVLAVVPDFHLRLSELASDWEREKSEELTRSLATLRALAFLLVFATVSAMILSMYSIQGQITSSIR